MLSIFSRLYLYRERAAASPLENFLTEAFGVLFERLDMELKRSLLKKLLPPYGMTAFFGAFPQLDHLDLYTQVSLGGVGHLKRPDMMLRTRGRDLIAIEAKVGAGILQHNNQPLDNKLGIVATQNQLETYATSMVEKNRTPDGWPGAVLFLTAWTPPPADFGTGRRLDGVITSVRTWKDVGEWITDNIEIGRKEFTHCAIAAEFYRFLQEQNLMTEYVTSRDLAAALLFVPSNSAFIKTFRDVIAAVAKHVPRLSAGRQLHVTLWGEANMYMGYFYFAESLRRNPSRPYVGVAVCFEVGDYWVSDQAVLPQQEPFFCLECSDYWAKESPRQFLARIPEGWVEVKDNMRIVRARPVSEFPADPDKRVEALTKWAFSEIDRLAECIPGYLEAPEGEIADDDDESGT